MDNLYNEPNFNPVKIPERTFPGRNLLKVVKFQNLAENVVMCGKYSLTKLASFLIIVLRAEIVTFTFGLKMVTISARNMTTSQKTPQQLVYKLGNISSEILSGSIGVLQYTHAQKYTI